MAPMSKTLFIIIQNVHTNHWPFIIHNNIYIYPYILNIIHTQYGNPRGSTTLTIVMQSSMEIHNTITYLYNLIHLTSIGDAAALLWSNGYCHMISGGGWWEWGNIQCTVGAYSWPGDEWSRSSVLERAYCPTSAQCPQVGAFRFSHQTLFFYEMKRSKLRPSRGGIKEYALSWPVTKGTWQDQSFYLQPHARWSVVSLDLQWWKT